jgi:N-acetylmuramoyl-L-alanine amidase
MAMSIIAISSGHGKYVRGASGIIDEVDEARRVVERLSEELVRRDCMVIAYHDDVSQSQNENLNRIVDFHNDQVRDLDISVHFNAYEQVDKPMGTEVLYLTQKALAEEVSFAIADVGFINRGAKKRTDLFFLNGTDGPSILIEVCFVDSVADTDIYAEEFDRICTGIADVVGGETIEVDPVAPYSATHHAIGACSHFGGPGDTGVSPGEGLAFISCIEDAPHLFLPYQPEGTTGLARRLNPYVHYVACRWDYSRTPKDALLGHAALVRSLRTGIALAAFPADWGPHEDTGRVADLSPGLMADLDINTDDEVEVIYPWVGSYLDEPNV